MLDCGSLEAMSGTLSIVHFTTHHKFRTCCALCCQLPPPQSVLPLELAATSKACYRLQSLLPPPELTAAFELAAASELAAPPRACYRLQSLLPHPELATASRACRRLTELAEPDPPDRPRPDLPARHGANPHLICM